MDMLAVSPAETTSIIPEDPFAFLAGDAVVAVAMSGGVDSSVAAARCAARGFRVIGITLAMWPTSREQARDRGCCSIDSVEDARRVANQLGIRHFTWNLEPEFRAEVIASFEDGYADGRTPNPCVRCNERIKFGVLLERAQAIGASNVATGHYARLGRRGDTVTLHRARDGGKDQAYTLHRLGQAQLGAAVFPLGATASKGAVREEAARLGLVTAAKPDSQELCFVGEDLATDLSRRLAGRFRPGPIMDLEGRRLGEHRGLPFYTVGQRSRLDLRPDRPDAAPLYVVAMDKAENRLVVGPGEALGRRSVRAVDCRWVGGTAPGDGVSCEAQLRAHGEAHPARVESAGPDHVRLSFAEPVRHVSTGQALVLYRGDEVLGGGAVEAA